MASDQPWQQLVGFRPLRYPAYARLRFLPDPAYEGQSENDVDVDEALTSTGQLRAPCWAVWHLKHAPPMTTTSASGTAGQTSRV
jgi:hypothetical protein